MSRVSAKCEVMEEEARVTGGVDSLHDAVERERVNAWEREVLGVFILRGRGEVSMCVVHP